jgi:hypothetical protein
MNVVKLITDDDGNKHISNSWHYIYCGDGANRTFCTLECFGFGESALKFKIKKGKINCPDCIRIINKIKAVKF